jgi:hypothetical protein
VEAAEADGDANEPKPTPDAGEAAEDGSAPAASAADRALLFTLLLPTVLFVALEDRGLSSIRALGAGGGSACKWLLLSRVLPVL